MSSETELDKNSPFASPNYRGFLLRHGSYERYKIRSMRMQQQRDHVHGSPVVGVAPDSGGYSHQVVANATLPRNRKKREKPAPSLDTSKPNKESCTTVIVINGCTGQEAKTSNSHRNVTKPRDVKNKSKSHKLSMNLKKDQTLIHQSGSVYCSALYGELSEDEHISYA